MNNALKAVRERLGEPSTYAGIGTVAIGLGQLAQVKEAADVADAIVTGGQAYLTTGSWVSGLIALGAGLVAAFRRDRR